MTDRICSILGETRIPPEQRAAAGEKLKEALLAAVGDGYTWFRVPCQGDLGPLCAEVVAALRREDPQRRLILDAVFPKGGEAKGEALPGYDGVVLYDRARDGASDLAHYLVEGAARSIFLQFRDRRVRELVALNYAMLLHRDVRLVLV